MKHLEPQAAHQLLDAQPDSVFVDVRSGSEFLFVGHPVDAINVPWFDGPDWEPNPHFVGQVKKLAGANFRSRPVVLICRSGNRSLEAGAALEAAGFQHVYNVLHGFEGDMDEHHHRNAKNGWRVAGLPWRQY